MHLKKAVGFACALLLCACTLLLNSCQRANGEWHGEQKFIILGIDGMDPQLLDRFMQRGQDAELREAGATGIVPHLTTSIPPQSPVAWSNLITGMNAGGHGIFDFIHRDPKTFELYFSTSKVEAPKHC